MDTVLQLLQQPGVGWFVAIGFVAQLCDGAIGMGFGVISSTVLAAIGLPREIASASVNGAKLLTGAASGTAHVLLRNVDWRMLAVLASAGALGGIAGSLLLARHAGPVLGVLVSVYLIGVGVLILRRAFETSSGNVGRARIGGVGLAGGFLEAMSGVWGPLVTSKLVAFGAQPRYAVGTGSIAETFVAGVVFAVLVSHLGFAQLSSAMLGLIGGALLAVPLAALVARELPRRPLMIAVGVMVMVLSVIRLARDLGV
jgi:uncharacterized membrane protein YfcA